MPFVLATAAFTQTVDEVGKRLAHYGDVDAADEGSRKSRRRVSFRVAVPGYGAPVEVTLELTERYRRTAQGWLREGYLFEYRRVIPRSRNAHHQHGAWGTHQHCEAPGKPSREHYHDVERLLEPTLEDFGATYERGEPIRCMGLRPKRRPQ